MRDLTPVRGKKDKPRANSRQTEKKSERELTPRPLQCSQTHVLHFYYCLNAWLKDRAYLVGKFTNTANAVSSPAALHRSKQDKATIQDRFYVLDYNDDKIRCGIMNGSIALTVADNGATSNIGMEDDQCKRTGVASNKVFILPGGQALSASEIAKYPFKLRPPANKVHITPGITNHEQLPNQHGQTHQCRLHHSIQQGASKRVRCQ